MLKLRLLALIAVLMVPWVACDDEEEGPADVATDVTMEVSADADVADEADEVDEGDVTDEEIAAPLTVSVLSPFEGPDAAALLATVADFEDDSGIDVDVEASGALEDVLLARIVAGSPPDIAIVPQPGFVLFLAEEGYLIDLGAFVESSEMIDAFGSYLTGLVTTDDGLWGVWYKIDVKSLIWYPKAAFDAAGYTVPETWADLIALSDEIVADGGTPWCIAFESGPATGWPGTDWIEDIMLRTAGPDVFDQWVAHEIPFTDDDVKSAFEVFGEVVFADNYVLGGPESIPLTFFGDTAPLVADPPECWFHRQASFFPAFLPEGTELGTDVSAFVFPTIEAGVPPAMLGGGVAAVMLDDRPEVREFVEYLLTPESAVPAAQASPAHIVPHLDFDTEDYGDPFQAVLGEAAQTALAGDAYRFDGSDLMPPPVGQNTFWRGMVDYVTDGPDNLDEVLAAIEAGWPTE